MEKKKKENDSKAKCGHIKDVKHPTRTYLHNKQINFSILNPITLKTI